MINIAHKPSTFSAIKDFVSQDLEEVNKFILSKAQSQVELIPMISEYLTSAGGKRIRPVICLLCGKITGADMVATQKLATSVEFIHTATLLHDDVIDESPLRRGKRPANRVWGNKSAILVGDFLLSQAFKLMVESGSLQALDLLAQTACEITESEVWQLDLINKADLGIDDYIKLINGKTATLFSAACKAPAIIANADKNTIKDLQLYGHHLGLSFQMMDDILDYFGDSEQFGKSIGGDFFEGKITLPLIIAMQEASSPVKQQLISLITAEHKTAESFQQALAIMNSINCKVKSIEFTYKHSEFAKQHAKKVDSSNLLCDLVDEIMHRVA
jgi:octaprenyl-diphosphate synthase